MGIRGLNKIIKRVAPHIIREKIIQSYTHSSIAIDSSILLYKYRYACKDSEDSHIHGFIQRVCFYLKRGILPIFVFDGIPPNAKQQVLEKRVKQKNKIEEKIQCLVEQLKPTSTNVQTLHTTPTPQEEEIIQEEITKLSKQVTYVTRSHRQECKYLLRLMGIPMIEAHGEAEATCAALQKNKLVDYTFTEDTDALTFGSPIVLRSARKLEKVIEVQLEELLHNLNLNMNEFIDFCILCGCDYCTTIPKIGPVTSLSLVQEHSTIENILNILPDKYTIPDKFDYQIARDLFKNPLQLPTYDLTIKPLQNDKLKLFLTNEKNMSTNIFENVVKRYSTAVQEYNKKQKTKPLNPYTPNTIKNYFTNSTKEPNTPNTPNTIKNYLPKEPKVQKSISPQIQNHQQTSLDGEGVVN